MHCRRRCREIALPFPASSPSLRPQPAPALIFEPNPKQPMRTHKLLTAQIQKDERKKSSLRVFLSAAHCWRSRVPLIVVVPPLVTVMVRSQLWKPLLPMLMVWSPGGSRRIAGALPENLPSTVISAPSGVDFTVTVARSSRGRDAACSRIGPESGGSALSRPSSPAQNSWRNLFCSPPVLNICLLRGSRCIFRTTCVCPFPVSRQVALMSKDQQLVSCGLESDQTSVFHYRP